MINLNYTLVADIDIDCEDEEREEMKKRLQIYMNIVRTETKSFFVNSLYKQSKEHNFHISNMGVS